MILVLHIVIALASLGLGAYAVVAPSRLVLWLTGGLVALTVASGTAVALAAPAHLVQACWTGLGYLVVMAGLVGLAVYRREHAR